MNRRDEIDVIDAIRKYTEPMIAEFRTYRAEVASYRAEVAAWRAEARADMDRMERKFTEHDDDIAAMTHRLFPEDGDS